MMADFASPDFLNAEVVATKSGWAPRLEYEIVDTIEALHAMRDTMLGTKMPGTELHYATAYDTETSGLKVNLGARAIGHAFAYVMGAELVRGWYVPIRHIGPDNENAVQLDPFVVAAIVDEILNSPGEVCMFHAKFDIAMARADGVSVRLKRSVRDVGILATAFNENEPRFKMKALAALYCTPEARTEESWLDEWMKKDARGLKLCFKKRSKKRPDEMTYLERFGYARTPIRLCAKYAIRDVFYTIYLRFMQYHNVEPMYPALIEREHEIMWLLHEMEWNGLLADPDEILRTQDLVTEDLNFWLDRCKAIVLAAQQQGFIQGKLEVDEHGIPIFDFSDEFLRDLLYFKCQMVPPEEALTDGGKFAVNKEAREILKYSYPQWAPLIDAIDRGKKVEKMKTTYCGSFYAHYSHETKCIHPTYNQLERKEEGGVPVTGRLSSADPNAQNVEKKPIHLARCECKKCRKDRNEDLPPGEEKTAFVRRYFLVPPGYIRFFFDFSQIELRALAWFSRDPRLLECYANDLDVHAITSAEVTGGDRDIAKQVNFGNSYGMTEIGLAKRMVGYARDPKGTRAKAKVVLENFFRVYAGIPRFRRDFAAQARRNGNRFVNPFGRPRHIPELGAHESWVRDRGERMMMSSIISGTCADLMKESMIRCDRLLKRESPESKTVQTIHDELVFDIYAAQPGWSRLIPMLKYEMENWPMFSDAGVPIKVGIKYSTKSWATAQEMQVLADGSFKLAA